MSGEAGVAPDGGLIQSKLATELLRLSASKLANKLVRAAASDSDPDVKLDDEDGDNNHNHYNGGLDNESENGHSSDATESNSGLMANVCKGIASPIQSTANSNITTTATTPTNINNNNPATTNHNLIGMVAGLLKKEAILGEAGVAMDAESGNTAADGHTLTNQEANNNNSNVINNNTGAVPSQNHHRKLFECDVCNMKFSNGANMRRHKMRHTGVKPYECRICQKRFFRKDHLAEHFTTHTKTLPYHCPICNRGFQRQIAMRAHFQNEHVGQHDLVKTCPLCSYRAGTMKSLRVHFFNRHGIDLDNPGPGAPSSLLLALDSPNASQLLPQLVAAAAQAQATTTAYSDSGDSLRSTDNGTPPMHFLTPHVEISMGDNNAESFQEDYSMQSESTNNSMSGGGGAQGTANSGSANNLGGVHTNGGGSPEQSPHSVDSNSNAPTSSLSMLPVAAAAAAALVQSTRHSLLAASDSNASITPSISLIPIKQEPNASEEYLDTNNNSNAVNKMMTRLMNATANSLNSTSSSPSVNSNNGSGDSSPMSVAVSAAAGSTVNESAAASSSLSSAAAAAAAAASSLTSLIKVSPLKSLLREDLKRRINARASNRASRNNSGSNNNGSSRASPSPTSGMGGGGGSGGCNSTNSNNNGSSDSPSLVATTSNGVITSTGPENDLIALNRKRNLQCLFCGIEFPDQTLYFLHKGCHSESNPWKCNICGEQMNNVYEFNSHLLSKSHQ